MLALAQDLLEVWHVELLAYLSDSSSKTDKGTELASRLVARIYPSPTKALSVLGILVTLLIMLAYAGVRG